jgi:hypothetical protein
VFRVTINEESVNKNDNRLGDRDLTVLLGTTGGGILSFSTYTYTDMNAGGDPNVN